MKTVRLAEIAKASGAPRVHQRWVAADKAAATASREMGLATSVFQIAIALGGITLVVKKRWLWYTSLFTGLLAVAQMAKVLETMS